MLFLLRRYLRDAVYLFARGTKHLQLKLEQILVETRPENWSSKYSLHTVGAVLFGICVLCCLSQIRNNRLKHAQAAHKVTESSKLKENKDISESADTTTSAHCSDDDPVDTYECGSKDGVVYVAQKLTAEQFAEAGLKHTTNSLTELYLDDEFRTLIKKRRSTPSSFNWQARRSLGMKT